ncbi:hypothetical protein CVT24_001448 [Panaeolus cyanescens]|uniref:Peroxidase n=1 Tax=Panaeolus cyanescens TaxID=181874 RepID=A0A409WSF9_9AGAR|nr:hypothetical protein CVT24_001448 [Panaeolus cyanescens]
MYEGPRNNGRELQILGCSPNSDLPNQTTVSATWLRAAFHDASTFNITDGTGGLDASIYYELDRGENAGIDDVLHHFAGMPSKYVSKADMLAIAAVFAVADCGGPIIPLSGGRIDAKGPGRTGVPEPDGDIPTHIDQFLTQGFSPPEMIEMVACGHTLGGVSSKNFPTIVTPPVDGILAAGNFSLSESFDSTPTFDNKVVTEYLSRTTRNMLVVGPNTTTWSDRRIFGVDNDATMKTLADPEVFRARCAILFERMLHNVPSGTPLTPRIDVLPEKPQHAGLRIINGTLTFATTLRLARSWTEPFTDPSRVSLLWCDRYGPNADCRSGTANKLQGAKKWSHNFLRSPLMAGLAKNFRYYHFQAPIDVTLSVSRFWWEVDNGNSTSVYNNGGEWYPLLQDQIIFPSVLNVITGFNITNTTTTFTNFVVAGVRDGVTPDRVYVTILDHTYTDPRLADDIVNITIDLVQNSTLSSVSGYTLYSGSFSSQGVGPTIDFHIDAGGKTTTLDYQALRAPFMETIADPYAEVPIGTPTSAPYTGKVHYLAFSNALFLLAPAFLAEPHPKIKTYDYLRDRGRIPIVLYDQIGNGRSSHYRDCPEKFWTPSLFSDELKNLLRRLGIYDNYDLFGHSWGGFLAAYFSCSRENTGLHRLILSNSPASMKLMEDGLNILLDSFGAEFAATIRKHEEEGTTSSTEYLEGLTQFATTYICSLWDWPEELQKSFGANEEDSTVVIHMMGRRLFTIDGTLRGETLTPYLRNITVPTLVLNSDKDEMHDVAVRPLAEHIKQAKWVKLTNSTHVPMYEEPDR